MSLYLDVPSGFPSQVAIIEKPMPEYLPDHPWLLLGDKAVRPVWDSLGMPEPEVSNWVETSEAEKRMEALLPWLEHWAANDVYRDHVLVAVGGGILTDMGGLAASLYMRGIAWHSWPTSLLAQIDAGIGGKTAVNLDSGKNLAGSFHHPSRVVIARQFLDSLPKRHQTSGMWELIKMALVEGDIAWAESMLGSMAPNQEDIRRSVQIKIGIVHNDFKDSNERRLLNLGHTFGHAMESASNFELLHGEAVGLGTLAACLLSGELGAASFPQGFIKKLATGLAPLLPLAPPWEKCLPYLMRDKKNDPQQKICCILPIPGSRPAQQKISPANLGAIHAKLLSLMKYLH
jgi:3-dehydroquinate synthase